MGSLGSIHTHDFQSHPHSGGAGGASSGLLPPVVGDKGPGLAAGKKALSGGKGKAPGEKGKGSGNQENSLTGVLDTVTRRLNEQAHDELLGGRLAIKKRGRAGRIITGSSEEGKELIKEMAAAILHNLSLKRAVLGPGILTCLLSLTKGTPLHHLCTPHQSILSLIHPITHGIKNVCCRWPKVSRSSCDTYPQP